MATRKYVANVDLQQNELQNAVIQNLSTAPSNPKAGQHYFNTANHTEYVYDGTNWVDSLSQGDYTFTNGLTENSRTVSINVATGANAGNVTLTADTNGLAASAPTASTSTAGLIEIATDTEATTGTSETLAVNPKQLATKLDKLSSGPTAGTYSRVTVTADGLVSSGGDISVASASANYMTYTTASGELSLNVDTTVTDSSTNLVTSGAVSSAIASALVGALNYQGAWNATGESDYSSITLPVKKGYMYLVEGSATIGGVEWNAGDYLIINKDVAADGTITSSDVDKIDNTEGTDIVRLSATQTLTNKTIDADDNTITDLTTSNLKSGVLVEASSGSSASGSDTAIYSQKATNEAIATATSGFITASSTDTLTNKTIDADDNTISDLTTTNFKSGVVVTSVGSTGADTSIPTEKAVRSAISALKVVATNPALTASGGQVTWNVTAANAPECVCSVRETSTGAEVYADVTYGSGSVTIKMNSGDLSAGDYTAVIIG